jgi:hypothetical protein
MQNTERYPLALRSPVGNGMDNDPSDVLGMKQGLRVLGYYADPGYGMTGMIDREMTQGLRAFQAANDLKQDGWAAPGGETEAGLNAALLRLAANDSTRSDAAPAPAIPRRAPAPPQPALPPAETEADRIRRWRDEYPDLPDPGLPTTRLDPKDGKLSAEFRDAIARAEGNNKGYGESGPGAHGRYQMKDGALAAAQLKDKDGEWLPSAAIQSSAEFLANPLSQELALEAFNADNLVQLKTHGSLEYVGREVDGLRARFIITEAGLAAAAHRLGPTAVSDYLRFLQSQNWNSEALKGAGVHDAAKFKAVETRLRTFEKIPLWSRQ